MAGPGAREGEAPWAGSAGVGRQRQVGQDRQTPGHNLPLGGLFSHPLRFILAL